MSDEVEFLAVTESDLKDSYDESGKCFCLRDGGRPVDGGAGTTIRQLLELQEQIHEDPVRISDNRTFDQLFYAVDSYGALSTAVRSQLIETLYSALVDVVTTIQRTPAIKAFKSAPEAPSTPSSSSNGNSLRRRLSSPGGSGGGSFYLDSSDAHRLRNSAKMSCFLMAWSVRMATRFAENATVPTGKKSGKSASKASESSEGWGKLELRERVLSAIYDLVSIDGLGMLWPRNMPDDSFLNVVLGIPFSCIRNPENMKALSVRKCIGLILGSLGKRYPQQELFITAEVLELLLDASGETMAPQLGDMFQTVLCDFDNYSPLKSILGELLARIQSQQDTLKTDFVKNCSIFITEMCKRISSVMPLVESLPVFTQFLSFDYHTLRECTLQVLSLCVRKLSVESLPAMSDEQKASIKADALNILQERFLDVSSNTRIKVLQVWGPIVEMHLVPAAMYANVAASSVARMDDSNAFVRRAASKLVLTLIENNPYAPVLSSHLFHKKKVLCWKILNSAMTIIKKKHVNKEEDVIKEEEEDVNNNKDDVNNKEVDNNEKDDIDEDNDNNEDDNNDKDDVNDNEDDIDDEEDILEYSKEKDKFKILTTDETELAEFAQKRIDSEKVTQLFAGTPQQNAPIPASRLVNELTRFYTWASEGEHFSDVVSEAFDAACRMLYSRTQLDVIESIKFIVAAKKFKVEGSDAKIKKMFHLVWAKEDSVRRELFGAFSELYFGRFEKYGSIAENIITLVNGSSPSELASLSEIFNCLQAQNNIKSGVINTLFKIFSNVENPPVKRRNSLIALEMFAHNADCARFIVKMIGPLVSMTLAPTALRKTPDLAFCTCKILQKIRSDNVPTRSKSAGNDVSTAVTPMKKGTSPGSPHEDVIGRIPNGHKLFRFLLSVFECRGTEDDLGYPTWSAIAEQAINAVSVLAENPDQLFEQVIKTLHGSAFGLGAAPGSVSSIRIAKLLFAAGHIAVKVLVHIEVVKQNMERLSKEREAAVDDSSTIDDSASAQATPRRKGRSTAAKTPSKREQRGSREMSADEEAQIQITGRKGNDIDFERLQASAEEQLAAGIVASYTPLVVAVCMNEGGVFNSSYLRTAGVLALSKFMCVAGKKYCESKLRLLVTLLSTAPEPELRATVVIAMNDLFIRYPNTTEAWTKFLFERLCDVSPEVRRNAISVISHLVLNDLVKLKENSFGLALALEDDDPEVSKLARLFFTEFSKKGNAIFNELFSLVLQLSEQVKKGMKIEQKSNDVTALSQKMADDDSTDSDDDDDSKYVIQTENGNTNAENGNDIDIDSDAKSGDLDKHLRDIRVDSAVFRSVVKFLFSFLQKDKQIETLIEKLCSNFRDTSSYPEGLAYCLSLFTYTEKTLQRVIDMYGTYQPYLRRDEVYESFRAIVLKSVKFQTGEMKTIAEKLDYIIKIAHGDVKTSDDVDKELASLSVHSSSSAVIQQKDAQKKRRNVKSKEPAKKRAKVETKKKKKKKRSTKKKVIESDSEESDFYDGSDDDDDDDGYSDNDEEDEEEEEEKPKKKSKVSRNKRAKRKVIGSDSDDSMGDDDDDDYDDDDDE